MALLVAMAIRDHSLPFGHLPGIWGMSHAIDQIEGTRWYVERGGVAALRQWLEEVHEANPGDLIPMQWAPHFIGVSRTAIRKRATAGKITVLTFIPVEPARTILGKEEYREGRSSFDYLILSECKAWQDELFERFEEELTERRNRDRIPKQHRRKKGEPE